jgi:uncharacterized cupredoxin-like copper-binding protein
MGRSNWSRVLKRRMVAESMRHRRHDVSRFSLLAMPGGNMRRRISVGRKWFGSPLLAAMIGGLLLVAGLATLSNAVPAAFGAATPVPSPEASSGAATPSSSPEPSTPAPIDSADRPVITTGEVMIQLTDTGITPRHFEVAAGHDLHLTVTNSGTRTHTFTIEELDISVSLDPGATEIIAISKPPLGEYRYGIDLEQDPAPAMTGTFTIYI